MSENTSMTVRPQQQAGIVTFQEMVKAAEYIAKSGLFGVKTVDQAMALGMIADSEGRKFASAARDYHIIQGRPALKADSILSRFQQAGGSVQWKEYTKKKCSAVFSHQQGGSLLVEWTLEMAGKVKTFDRQTGKETSLLDKDNWKNYPRAQLKARCISEGVRAVYAPAIAGFYTPEEVIDFDEHMPEKEITAQVTTSAPSPIDTAKQKVKAAAPKKATAPAAAEAPKPAPAAPATPTPAAPTTPPTPAPAADPNAWKAKLCGAFLSKHGLTQKQLEAWRQKDLDAWVQEDREFFLAQFKDAQFNTQEIKDYLAAVEADEKGAPDPDAPPAEADEVLPPEDPNAAV